ncbi:hypothetical protein AQUCO_00100671v1 [Aquilegia coerulea]|uniref:Uncharacterized protein n=1 Tax=Aquilegia coerulea TaxID=218851 RepID=A0A2G5FBS5_AQUCA|nr:hypothetical protein AQUCO_00100671v1 [Aquilegia coerulea]
MAIATTTTTTTSCCFNLPSSPSFTPPPNSSSTKPNQISWYGKVGSWRKQCFVGITTCMIIGSEMMPLMGTEFCAIADNYMEEQIVVVDESKKKNVVKWSDTRSCPAWKMNSLEIIVPENLPRPSSHRRSESITFSKINPNNPITIRLKVSKFTNCFSM